MHWECDNSPPAFDLPPFIPDMILSTFSVEKIRELENQAIKQHDNLVRALQEVRSNARLRERFEEQNTNGVAVPRIDVTLSEEELERRIRKLDQYIARLAARLIEAMDRKRAGG